MSEMRLEERTSTADIPPRLDNFIWLIVILSLVGFILFSISTYLLIKWIRQSPPYTQPGQTLSDNNVEEGRRRKRTASDLSSMSVNDEQRKFIIRKSLASRTSSQASAHAARHNNPDGFRLSISGSLPQGDLRDDWKRWEAMVQTGHKLPIDSHPATSS